MRKIYLFLWSLIFVSLLSVGAKAQTTASFVAGSLNTTSFGPIIRSSATSPINYSRCRYIYTPDELSAQGILPGSVISSLAWERGNNTVMSGTGSAIFKVYLKNSTATTASNEMWSNLITGASLVVDELLNTTNNLTASAGWWTLNLNAPFVYVGGSLEIAVDWDCSAVTGGATTGAFNWLTGSAGSVKTSHASSSTPIASTTHVTTNRPNLQIGYTYTTPTCPAVSNLNGLPTATDVTLSWTAGGTETVWQVEYGVLGTLQGAGTVLNATSTTFTIGNLNSNTNYVFYVKANCGNGDMSFEKIITVKTACNNVATFFENFDSYPTGYVLPDCWTSLTMGSAVLMVSSLSPASGTRNLYQFSNTTTNASVAVMPDVNNINAGTHRLRFKARSVNTNPATFNVGYVTNRNDITTFVTLQTVNVINTVYGVETIVNFPTNIPSNAAPAIQNPGLTPTAIYYDDFYWEAIPTCPQPHTLSASVSSLTNATLSWVAGGSETSWDIEWGAAGFAQGTGTLVSGLTANSYNLAGLTTTTYSFYVRAVCNPSDISGWTGPFNFLIGYCTSQPANVDGLGIINVNMGSINNSTGAEPNNYGDYTAFSTNVVANSTLTVNITYNTGIWTYNTFAWVDWNSNYIFEPSEATYLGESQGIVPSTVTNYITIPNVPSGNYRIRIGGADTGLGTNPATANPCFSGVWAAFEDYTLTVGTPTCPPITNLTGTSTPNDIALSWTAGAGETAWQIEYGVLGTLQGAGTVLNATSTNFTFSNLTPNTNYIFYVSAACGNGDLSLAQSVIVSTPCTPIADFFENFENYSIAQSFPNCWTALTSGSGVATISSLYPFSGVRSLYQYSSGSSNPSVVVTPDVTNINAGTHRLRFKARVGNVAGIVNVGYITDRNDMNTFVSLQTVNITNTVYGLETIVNFPTNIPSGAAPAIQNLGITAASIHYDDFYWEAIPTCPQPQTLSASVSSLTSATLSWVAGGSETSWDIEWGAAGFAQGTGTLVSGITTNSYNLTGLTSNSSFYVRAVCGAGDLSAWTGPFTFTVGYCTPQPNSVDGLGIVNVSMGSINNSTGAEPNNYGDYTAFSTTVVANTTLTINVTYNTSVFGYNTFAWVDWNNNLVFETSEATYLGESQNVAPSTVTSSIAIPNVAVGNYRIRIGGSDFGLGSNPATANPCYTGSWASFEDYTLTVGIPAPNDLSITDANANGCEQNITLTIDITNQGSATQSGFDVAYTVDSGVVVTETINASIAAGQTYTHTFATTFDATTAGNYNIQAFVTLPNDANANNNTFTTSFTNIAAFPTLFIENFDSLLALPNGWYSDGGVGILNSSNALFKYVDSFTPTSTTILPKVGTVAAGDQLLFTYTYTDYNDPTTPLVLGAGDSLIVQVSNDCGATYSTIGSVSASNHTPNSTATLLNYDLSAYIGSNIIVKIVAICGGGSYYVELDDFLIGQLPINAFSLQQPSHNTVIGFTNSTLQNNVSLAWQNAATVSNVNYSVQAILPNGTFSAPVMAMQSGAHNSITFPVAVIDSFRQVLNVPTGDTLTLMWRVIAQTATHTFPSSEVFMFHVIKHCDLALNANAVAVNCNAGADGNINLAVTGATEPLNYTWNGGQNAANLTGLQAGDYNVTITDAENCTLQANFAIAEPTPLEIAAQVTFDALGGQINATAIGGTAPYSYLWSNGATTPTITGLIVGDYTLTVTDANNCTTTQTVVIENSVGSKGAVDYINALTVTPNPTIGNATIRLDLQKLAEVNIQIYNINGQLLQNVGTYNTYNEVIEIDLSEQPEGVYLIRFLVGGAVVTRKLVVTR